MQHILVLDDDELMRDLLHALLSMEGYEVTEAGSGAEAARLLPGTPTFDLILADLHMPGLEGEALLNSIRNTKHDRTLLIGISATAPDNNVRARLDGFLQKPFDTDELHEAIRAAQGGTEINSPHIHAEAERQHEAAPLDENIFSALCRTFPLSQLGELYAMTLADIDKRLARMQDAANAGDLATTRREAHTIKGSSGFVGATELQKLAAIIEGGLTLDTSAMAEIPSACLRLRRMLDRKLQPA
jgi:CheY-like chemotaxis protein